MPTLGQAHDDSSAPTISASRRGCCRVAGGAARRRRTNLPVAAGTHDRSVRARWADRCDRTPSELADLIKANPGKFSYSSPGLGTSGHLIGELFRMSLGLDLVHVPFPGAGPAVAATIAGHTPMSFGSPASTVGQIKDGKL